LPLAFAACGLALSKFQAASGKSKRPPSFASGAVFMPRERPPALLAMGCGCLAFALGYFVWLAAYQGSRVADMLAVLFGNSEAFDELSRLHLASTPGVFLTVLPFCLELVLLGILLWCGFGLVTLRGSARWSALFFVGTIVPLALADTVLRLTLLTMPRQSLPLAPFLMDAVVIQFAIVLCGTMFLPSVAAAYQPAPANDAAGPR
jgi:hypothetical protein